MNERPIELIDGRHVAVCPFDHRRDVVLSDDDLQSFIVEPDALVRELICGAGLEGEPSQLAEGLWHLGLSPKGCSIFVCFTVRHSVPLELISLMKQVAQRRRVVLLLPHPTGLERARLAESNISACRIIDVLAADQGGFRLSIGGQIPPDDKATLVRLSIFRDDKLVVLDGDPKHLPEQAFQLLLLLAEHALQSAAVLDNRMIEDALWGSSVHRISSQVREPIRVLKDALSVGAKDRAQVRALIENRRNPNGYRLRLQPDEIRIAASSHG